jgi:O-methyltransferase
MFSSNLKSIAKRSRLIHSSYKIIRDIHDLTLKKVFNISEFKAVFQVLPNTMLPLPRLFDAYETLVTVNEEQLAGDIVECGVWNGGCVGLMALANAHRPGPQRKFHLFDSFEGLPQPSSSDSDMISGFKKSNPDGKLRDDDQTDLISIGACVGLPEKKVEDFLVRQLGLPRDNFVFHVGWFQQTIPDAVNSLDNIAVLRLDGDYYESTKVCLDGLYDRVVKNGFIVVDDYGTFQGCKKAVDEFLLNRNIRPKIYYSDSDCIYFRKP